MLLLKFGIFLISARCIEAELSKSSSATDLQTSLQNCEISNLSFLDARENSSNSSIASVDSRRIRCFATELGLWNDVEGFKAKRLVAMLRKHKNATEIQTMVTYCNERHKRNNLDKWASDAFYCFARGSMCPWISEYVKNVLKRN